MCPHARWFLVSRTVKPFMAKKKQVQASFPCFQWCFLGEGHISVHLCFRVLCSPLGTLAVLWPLLLRCSLLTYVESPFVCQNAITHSHSLHALSLLLRLLLQPRDRFPPALFLASSFLALGIHKIFLEYPLHAIFTHAPLLRTTTPPS